MTSAARPWFIARPSALASGRHSPDAGPNTASEHGRRYGWWMAAKDVTLGDLGRDPGQVAVGLAAWQRGEPDEAVLQTLVASSREMSRSGYTLWAWEGRTTAGETAWVLPITAAQAAAFAPRGPAAALARCVEAAVALGGGPDGVRLEEWRGYSCLVAPGMVDELAPAALEDAHPAPGRARVGTLPPTVVLGGPPVPLTADPSARGRGLVALGRELSLHPLHALLALLLHGLPARDIPDQPTDLARSLRDLGCAGARPATVAAMPRLNIDDDACPRRRHARRVLRRLLQKGKIGGHHTEIGHFTRGLPDHEKRDAKEVVEALLRAGLLVEKPSVGQRHISLNRESLPEIHSLIDRGATIDPHLAQSWTAPAPGETWPRPAARLRPTAPEP